MDTELEQTTQFERIFKLASNLDDLLRKESQLTVWYQGNLWYLTHTNGNFPYHLLRLTPKRMQHGWSYPDILDVAARIVRQ